MYIETNSQKLSAAMAYIVNGVPSDYLSESDVECLSVAPIKDLYDTLLISEIKHVEKYGRPITGNLYLGEKEMSIYNRLLVERIKALPNIDELMEYLTQ